jgi:hypothetical protein
MLEGSRANFEHGRVLSLQWSGVSGQQPLLTTDH